jgi:hypothetical protein
MEFLCVCVDACVCIFYFHMNVHTDGRTDRQPLECCRYLHCTLVYWYE